MGPLRLTGVDLFEQRLGPKHADFVDGVLFVRIIDTGELFKDIGNDVFELVEEGAL